MSLVPQLVDTGFPLVVSGPSGVGKTVLCRAILDQIPQSERSISATTRERREGEVDGESYFFYSPARFAAEVESGGMAEWAEVHGRLYGTPRAWLDRRLAASVTVVLNIDVQGGLAIRRAYPDCVLVFLLPPSVEVLRARLEGRATDGQPEVERRLKRAIEEMKVVDQYDYVVVNGELEAAGADLLSIVRAERSRVSRRRPKSTPK